VLEEQHVNIEIDVEGVAHLVHTSVVTHLLYQWLKKQEI
jgi:hypothetical protein